MQKKRAIFTIITCSIAVVLLSCVLAVGLQSDGFGFLARAKEDGQPYGHDHTVDYDPAEYPVENIYIDWEAGPIEISVTDGGPVVVSESSSQVLDESTSMQVTLGDGNLRVKWDKERFRFNLFGWFGGQREKLLRIQLPRDVAAQLHEVEASNLSGDMDLSSLAAKSLELNSVSGTFFLTDISLSGDAGLNTVSGAVVAQGLEAKGLGINSTSGNFTLTGIQAQRVDCDTISGATSFAGSATEGFYANSVSGLIHVSLAACPQELSMDSVSGNLTVELPASASFSAGHDTLSGEFSCDFPSTGMGEGGAVYGPGPAQGDFHFTTTSGDITVGKAD